MSTFDIFKSKSKMIVQDPLQKAKKILSANIAVRYGIFGLIDSSGFFPPREFLNQFLLGGSDPCDQDGRMSKWQPFELSMQDYLEVKRWWMIDHTDAVEDSLGAESWNDWAQKILDD